MYDKEALSAENQRLRLRQTQKSRPEKGGFSVYSYTSDRFVECSGYNVVLLLFGELYEVYCIARNAHRELRILFGVLLRVDKRFAVKYVNVQMMSAFFNISVEQAYKVVDLICVFHYKFILS